jgi:oligopeptide/dipeptide ABC transporter ATP-binding protein
VLLDVRGLTSSFFLRDRVVRAVEDVTFGVSERESLGIVGESGSGKTATLMSILRLLPPPGRIVAGEIEFRGKELLRLSGDAMRRIRGNEMALVPQNPMAALNPLFSIEWQLREALTSHRQLSADEARERIVEALLLAGIPDPRRQLGRYPHEFSGGMRQRILIAMATLNDPSLMLADEPTTALDTTMQAKVLDLMAELVERSGMALLMITHNMGVVARICDRVLVMYAGQIVESGTAAELFADPLHPYTRELLLATPRLGERRAAPRRLQEAPAASIGCAFRLRCPLAETRCAELPALLDVDGERSVRCWVAQRAVGITGEPAVEAIAARSGPADGEQ